MLKDLACWKDPSTRWSTRIVEVSSASLNGTQYLLLEKNLAYPGGGGAPVDRVMINDAIPVDAIIDQRDQLHFVVSQGNFATGQCITCQIDEELRTTSRTSHTFQHLLSEAFKRMEIKTLKADMTGRPPYLQVSPTPTPEQLAQAFSQAQEWVEASLDVETPLLSPDVVQQLDVASSERDYESDAILYRVMRIPGITNNICGGLHVHNTAEIIQGLCHSISIKKDYATIRFEVGKKAQVQASASTALLAVMKRSLDATDADLTNKLSGLKDRLRAAEERTDALQQEWIEHVAQILLPRSTEVKGKKVLAEWVPIKPKLLRLAARTLVDTSLEVIILGTKDELAGKTSVVVFVTPDIRPKEEVIGLLGAVELSGGGNEVIQAGASTLLPAHTLQQLVDAIVVGP